ncbi:MAG: hypothetical protein RM368_21930 [Nostoc sp. DedSLP03]|nr:hypothetical protein [Nostoc sp. DedSLP03]
MSTTGYAFAPIRMEMLSAIANRLKVLSNPKLDLIVGWVEERNPTSTLVY